VHLPFVHEDPFAYTVRDGPITLWRLTLLAGIPAKDESAMSTLLARLASKYNE